MKLLECKNKIFFIAKCFKIIEKEKFDLFNVYIFLLLLLHYLSTTEPQNGWHRTNKNKYT